MRSRFSAYSRSGDATYLLANVASSRRGPASLTLDPDVRWTRLDILARTRGGMLDTEGTVEFVAHFRSEAGAGSQRENSSFVRVSDGWSYVSGVVE